MNGRIIGLGLQSVSSALFLDLDGTLIDIAQTPDGVFIPNDLVALLDNLTYRLDGALAIVTGRPIADIDRFLAPLAPVAAGIHGAELRTACHGEIELGGEPIDATVVDAVRRLAKTEVGIVVETKRVSIAVHYRLAPSAKPRIEASLRRILDDGPDHLILCPGRKVFEIVPRHVSKGAALETLLALPAFRGRQPVMIGDDVSDQSAFEASRSPRRSWPQGGGRAFRPGGGRSRGPGRCQGLARSAVEEPRIVTQLPSLDLAVIGNSNVAALVEPSRDHRVDVLAAHRRRPGVLLAGRRRCTRRRLLLDRFRRDGDHHPGVRPQHGHRAHRGDGGLRAPRSPSPTSRRGSASTTAPIGHP